MCKFEGPGGTIASGSSNFDTSVAFCSASNDGTVRAWTGNGDCRGVFLIPGELVLFLLKN